MSQTGNYFKVKKASFLFSFSSMCGAMVSISPSLLVAALLVVDRAVHVAV